MSVRIHQCRVLDATPDVVWRNIEDISTHPEWMKDAVEIRFLTPEHSGIGARFWCLTKVGPLRNRDVLVITEWQPAEVMGIEHTGVVTGTGRFTLSPDGRNTRMCWEEVLRFPWWMGGPVGERAAKPLLGRIWHKNLARLNERLNEQVTPGSEQTDAR